MSETKPSVLVIDDDEVFCQRLVRALGQRDFEAKAAFDAASALALARSDPPEYAVLDLRLGDALGLELLCELLAIERTTRVLVLTGYGSIASAVEAMRLGAADYLTKPADADQISAALRGQSPSSGAAPQTPTLARAEWEHMQRVLSDTGGNISEAARRLGLHRRSLQRKLEKLPPPR